MQRKPLTKFSIHLWYGLQRAGQVFDWTDCYFDLEGFLLAQTVKSLPAVQETQVLSVGQEGPLEKEMATHSSILAWKIPWTEEPGRLQALQRVRHYWVTITFTFCFHGLNSWSQRMHTGHLRNPWKLALLINHNLYLGWFLSYYTILQSYSWAYIWRKP